MTTTLFGELNAEKFDAGWRAVCEVLPATADTLRPMVGQHYLGKWPGVTTLQLAMWAGPVVVGMVIFAEPPAQTKVRYGGETWELARLWVHDGVPRNGESWLISKAVKYIKRHFPQVQYLVSYADPSVGHQGTIYQASNWRHDGRTDDERKSPRCDYVANGKKYSRAAHVPDGLVVERVPRVSKFRYVYTLQGVTP